jgi:hypothetical protein
LFHINIKIIIFIIKKLYLYEKLFRAKVNTTAAAEHDEANFQCKLRFGPKEGDPSDPPEYTNECETYYYVIRKYVLKKIHHYFIPI